MAKYDRGMVTATSELVAAGFSVTAICLLLGISRATFYRWLSEHPDFVAARVRGESQALLRIERELSGGLETALED